MFNLDQAIADWRQEMAQTGLANDVLDELESHLRDDLDAQLRSGMAPEDAFKVAAGRVGDARILNHEFATSVSAADRLKSLLFTLAGIPNQTLATTMNTTRIEPAWATYLKATTFLIPAIFLATVSAIFVVPKLQQICRDAGLPTATAGTFWNLIFSSIQMMLTLSNYGIAIAGGTIVLLLLLEWRFAQWPRYRRAAVGCGAFVLNSLVLFAFFMMFLAAIVAAPGLSR
jgi:hypothetical protein